MIPIRWRCCGNIPPHSPGSPYKTGPVVPIGPLCCPASADLKFILFISSDTSAILASMRQAILVSILHLLLCNTGLQAQDKLPAALEQRLIAFTDQSWNEWMKTGDIRSIRSMRVQEILIDPPCGLVRFTTQTVCEQLSKEERADYAQTVDNVTTLTMYRILSRQNVFDWLGSMQTLLDSDKADSEDALTNLMSKSASLSAAESSLMKETTGMSKDIDEFRQKWSRYKELERLFQADHLKDYVRPENQTRYIDNAALLDQAFKDEGAIVSKVDQARASSLPAGGDYFEVRKGFFIFVVRMMGDEMKVAFVQTVTK
jgi:hypothetical protein